MAILESKQDKNIKLFLNTRKHLLLSILFVWGAVSMLFFAIKPQLETVIEQRETLKKDVTQLEGISRKLNELKQIRLSDQFKQKDKVDEVLPSRKPVLELLTSLHQAMQQANVSVAALKINPGEITDEPSAELIAEGGAASKPAAQTTKSKASTKGYSQLQMELKVRGDNDSLDEFLTLIERAAPFTSVVELSIRDTRIGRGETAQTIAEAEMILQTYYYTQTITTNIDDALPAVGEAELRAFNTIQQFIPSDFRKPTQVTSSNIEDLFGITGFEFE